MTNFMLEEVQDFISRAEAFLGKFGSGDRSRDTFAELRQWNENLEKWAKANNSKDIGSMCILLGSSRDIITISQGLMFVVSRFERILELDEKNFTPSKESKRDVKNRQKFKKEILEKFYAEKKHSDEMYVIVGKIRYDFSNAQKSFEALKGIFEQTKKKVKETVNEDQFSATDLPLFSAGQLGVQFGKEAGFFNLIVEFVGSKVRLRVPPYSLKQIRSKLSKHKILLNRVEEL